jgi:histidine triad (HIT) family protein
LEIVNSATCAFCAIAHGEAAADVVYENDHAIAFLPLNPATLGHTLVIPRQHMPTFFELNESSALHLSSAVLRVASAVQAAMQPQGMNLITSAGEAAQQSVFHLHVHVLPRYTEDRVGDIWPSDKPISPEQRKGVQGAICQHLSTANSMAARQQPPL